MAARKIDPKDTQQLMFLSFREKELKNESPTSKDIMRYVIL